MSERVLISGASSGIGEYLAYYYARQGARLGLIARRSDQLEAVATQCRSLGGQAIVLPLDVTDPVAVKTARDTFLREYGGIDILIANAGISGDDHLDSGNPEAANQILTTNILGITNLVYPFVPTLLEQKSGHLVLISSIAGIRGLPRRGAYTASKKAVKALADSWRFTLERSRVRVSTIYPGFVRTAITARRKTIMPFLMDVEPAAAKIAVAITTGRKNYMFPWQWRLFLPVIKIIPDWIVGRVV